MSDYRPTFKRSAASRPLRQRLTPLAWALIGVVALVLVLGMVGGALSWASRPPDEVWNPTPTATLPPTETPALPSLTPTEWWEGMVTPTAQVTAASPAWWMGQMTQDEEGRWWPPDEVVEMVRDDFDAYVEARNEFVLGGEPPAGTFLMPANGRHAWYRCKTSTRTGWSAAWAVPAATARATSTMS
jgi:hypothetical protein